MHRAVRTSSLALLCAGFAFGLSTAAAAADFAQVYQDALASDPTFQQAYANYQAAREARPEAWAVLLPQISGSAGKSWTHSAGQITQPQVVSGLPTPYPIYSTDSVGATQWSLNLSQELFSWTDWMSLKAADSQVAEAQATYEAAAQNLILRVATAYFNVLSALDTLQAQQSSLQAFDLQLEQANKRFQVGLIAITDVEQARAARDNAAALVIAAKQSLATAEDQLQVITGRQYDTLSEPGADMPLVMPSPANQNQWVQTSIQQNLSLIASRLAADVARENVRIAFGGHLPTLSLIASRTFSSSNTDETIIGVNGAFQGLPAWSNDRQIGLEVTVPIFSGGGTEARVHQAEYQWIAAKDAVQQASRTTEQQARDAYLGVISGIAHVQALQQALTSSQTAYKATEAGYRVGTQTEVDVLNALSTLVQAKTNYASSRYAYITSVVQLRYAAGTLDANEVQAIDHWLTAPASVSPGAITPEAMTPTAPAPTPQPPPAPPPP
jgi:outer membrane protein